MGLWAEMNDFSMCDKKIPCVLCGQTSMSTVVGNHFKCLACSHLFNEGNEPLPEGIECYCIKCKPEPVQVVPLEKSPTKKKVSKVKGKRKK